MEDQPKRINKQEDVECAECSRQTMHTVLASWKMSWHSEDHDISGGPRMSSFAAMDVVKAPIGSSRGRKRVKCD